MVGMSIVTVVIVFYTHSQRTEPYLQSKKRRVQYVQVKKPSTLSLDYAAFGPQPMAYEIIGKERWQWLKGTSVSPDQAFDIKVIVYRNTPVAELQERFPVIEEKLMDPRYLQYDVAMEYLDRHIAFAASPELTARLRDTRKKLSDHFAP
jgi:hypothetical protein